MLRGRKVDGPVAVRFKARLLAGHKGLALQVPSEPPTPARPLRPGRRGHPVRVTIGGVTFESAVVPRSRCFWLLVDDEQARNAKVRGGRRRQRFARMALSCNPASMALFGSSTASPICSA